MQSSQIQAEYAERLAQKMLHVPATRLQYQLLPHTRHLLRSALPLAAGRRRHQRTVLARREHVKNLRATSAGAQLQAQDSQPCIWDVGGGQ